MEDKQPAPALTQPAAQRPLPAAPPNPPPSPSPGPSLAPKTPPPASRVPLSKARIRSIISTAAIILVAPAVALLLTAFAFQSYQVDGPSMETTLINNDRLIVWKTPRTWARITRHPYIPHRGDIVIFVGRGLGEFGQDPNKQLVKRVIALPGERVTVKDGILMVFNKANPNGFRPDLTMPYGKVIGETQGDNSWTLGKNQIFVCGDNRSNSLDSRAFGPVEAKDVVGKLVIRVLPLNQAKRF